MTTPHQTPDGMSLPGQAKRAAIEQEMELKFPNFELLVTAMSANISTSGMFIQSPEPAPVGTTLSFRFRIEDWSPIQGTARVVWDREQDEATDRPAGMGVKFVDLDSQSRRMIRYLIDKHLEMGGEPFDLGSPTEDVVGLDPEVPSTPRRSLQDRTAGTRLLWAVGALLMAGVLAIGLWFQSTRPPVEEEEPPRAMVEGGKTGPASPIEVSPTDQPPAADAPPMNRRAEEAIERLVQDWAEAWESRESNEVLSYYAADFKPAGRETRAQWEARMKREMTEASFIRIAVSALEISAPTATEGQASFYLSIRTDQRDETVATSFAVARSDDGWKITQQTSSR